MRFVDSYRFRPFEMHVESHGRTTVLRLEGEFDLSGKKQFKTRLTEASSAKPKEMILDLRDVVFIDSTGIALVLEAWNHALRKRLDFALLLGDGHPREALRQTGLDQAIPIVAGLPVAEYGVGGSATGNGTPA